METTIEMTIPEIQISYKNPIQLSIRPLLNNVDKMYNFLKTIFDNETIDLYESFKVIYLNRALHPLGYVNLSQGGMTGCIADTRLILGIGLKAACTYFIVAHNHPSGVLQPSRADIELTAKLKNGGKIVGIELQDHIIITSESYYSFAENELI